MREIDTEREPRERVKIEERIKRRIRLSDNFYILKMFFETAKVKMEKTLRT